MVVFQATCCRDGKHCCPHGYTCDSQLGQCYKANMAIAWINTVTGQQYEEEKVQYKLSLGYPLGCIYLSPTLIDCG